MTGRVGKDEREVILGLAALLDGVYVCELGMNC